MRIKALLAGILSVLAVACGEAEAPPAQAVENFSFSPVGQIIFAAGCPNATSDPNTLDCYQEGTWTPTIGGNATYNSRSGEYVKIGKVVILHGIISVLAIGTGSANTITGLPFPVGPSAMGTITWTGSPLTLVIGMAGASGSQIQILGCAVACSTVGLVNMLGNTMSVEFTVAYISTS